MHPAITCANDRRTMSEISNCMLLQIRKNNILKLEQLLKLNLVNDHIFIIDNNLAALYIDYK